MPSCQRRLEVVVRDSGHQVISDDSEAHSTVTEKREATEHPSLGEVRPVAQCSADSFR
jgi:hypothetical protein